MPPDPFCLFMLPSESEMKQPVLLLIGKEGRTMEILSFQVNTQVNKFHELLQLWLMLLIGTLRRGKGSENNSLLFLDTTQRLCSCRTSPGIVTLNSIEWIPLKGVAERHQQWKGRVSYSDYRWARTFSWLANLSQSIIITFSLILHYVIELRAKTFGSSVAR